MKYNVNNAEIAQLVEHNLAKVGVASSSLVFRSCKDSLWLSFFYVCSCSRLIQGAVGGNNILQSGLIRQYIPKGTDFSEITDEFVAWVEEKLNNRPRKRLGYITPNEKFNSILIN